MNKSKLLYIPDYCRANDKLKVNQAGNMRFSSKLEFYNNRGELIWEPLHNKTVIAGAALTLMKLFNLDRSCLENTPTYDEVMGLDDAAAPTDYPAVSIVDANGNVVGSMPDETQRIILGFCVGTGGAGLESSDVFNVPYASWITPDNMVPFRYPIQSSDTVDESIYKGKKTITLSNGQIRSAYYFKEFSNTPTLTQNYVSTIGTFTDSVSPETVYSNTASADNAQSFVELHLKITKDDCREYFIAHSGLEDAKINQLSLVSGWTKTVSRTKLNTSGNTVTGEYEVWQSVRPFSCVNFPSEILSSTSKSLSVVYTIYS